jgi:hypothetical protein
MKTGGRPGGKSQDVSDISPDILNQYRSDLEAAAQMDGAAEVTLQAGESVLVPEGWWHAAEGGPDSSGVGVGAWFR